MPSWVQEAVNEYSKRMPSHCRIEIKELQAEHRGKNADLKRLLESEGDSILQAIPAGCHVVALDRIGKQLDTQAVSAHMQNWMSDGKDVALIIGGPEGLSRQVVQKSDMVWSLSALTFAHPLVRVILAEQLYRAWTILDHHPYHR